jgi:IS5 family transposase
MQQLQRMTARQRQQQQLPKYRELLRITGQVVQNARQVVEQTKKIEGIDVVAGVVIDQLRKEIAFYCDLADRVMDQTRRRVIDGEEVPSDEKVYSIFEPHTDLIKRGKAHKPVEFGHKVFLAESAQGLITDYRVLQGNPVDFDHVEASLERHQQTFQHPPEWYAADRGFYSPENIERCQQAKVEQVCIPQRGGQKTAEQAALERSPAFKKAQRFRVGIEGRISVLFRGRGMKRCRAKGRERFEMLVGAAVLANNLMRIAQLIEDEKPKRRRAA